LIAGFGEAFAIVAAGAGVTGGLRATAVFTSLAEGAFAGAGPGFAGDATDALSRAVEGWSSPRKCSSSLPMMASFMTVIQMGSAAFAPVSLSPSDSRLSYPTQTPQVTDGEKPRNHASV